SKVILQRFNLAFNVEFHFLACKTCGIAVSGREVLNHLTDKHPDLVVKDGQLACAMSGLDVCQELSANIRGPREPIPELSIVDAFACNHC
ncbi:hypothetical protein ID866_12183, partial [Astraeus odoratus]